MANYTTHVAMDTHKKEHKVTLHYSGDGQIVEFVVNNTPGEIKKMVSRITRRAAGDVLFCYEAGVCGFTLKRRIEALGCQARNIEKAA